MPGYDDRTAQTPYAYQSDQEYLARQAAAAARANGLLGAIERIGMKLESAGAQQRAIDSGLLDDIYRAGVRRQFEPSIDAINRMGARVDARDSYLLDEIESFDFDKYFTDSDTDSIYSDTESLYSDDEEYFDNFNEVVDEIDNDAFAMYTRLANQFVDLKKFVGKLDADYTSQKQKDYKESSYTTFMFKSAKPNPERLQQIRDLKATVKMFDNMEALTREPEYLEDCLEYADDIKGANRVIQGAILNLHQSLTQSSYDSQLAKVLQPAVDQCSAGVKEAAQQAYKEHCHSIDKLEMTDNGLSYSLNI